MINILKKQSRYFYVSLLAILTLFWSWGISSGASPESSSWKFAVISDTQTDYRENDYKSCINDSVIKAITEDIILEKTDLVLVSGDFVSGWFRNDGIDYDIQYSNWKIAMRPVYDARILVYPVRGNHDSGPERVALPPLPSYMEPPLDTPVVLEKAFLNAFTESYIPKNGPAGENGLTYSFTHKNAFIIGLDQFTVGQHKINQDWLDKQLATNKNQHIFIFGHEPAFETNHADNLSYYQKERDQFWDSIGKAGARIYFCGHDHFYNRALIPDNNGNEIRQVISGTGGGRLRSWAGRYKESERVKGEYHNGDHNGYVLVTIEGPKVTVIWKALIKSDTSYTWKVLDTFTYTLPARPASIQNINKLRNLFTSWNG